MENLNHCMNIEQAKLTVNAHKRNLLNSVCNNGYVYVKQQLFSMSECHSPSCLPTQPTPTHTPDIPSISPTPHVKCELKFGVCFFLLE